MRKAAFGRQDKSVGVDREPRMRQRREPMGSQRESTDWTHTNFVTMV